MSEPTNNRNLTEQCNSFQEKNKQYLEKLSERSHEIKIKQKEEEQEPKKILEKNFSIYNSGANFTKSQVRSRSNPKNIEKWETKEGPQIDAKGKEVEQTLENRYYEDLDLQEQSYIKDLISSRVTETQKCLDTLKQSDLEDESSWPNEATAKAEEHAADSPVQAGDVDDTCSYDFNDAGASQIELSGAEQEEFAPLDSLFTVDISGKEVPVKDALSRGIDGFMPVEHVEQGEHAGGPPDTQSAEDATNGIESLKRYYEGVGRDMAQNDVAGMLHGSGAVREATLNTQFGDTLPELNTEGIENEQNEQGSFKMVEIGDENDAPEQIPESLLQLMSAIDELPEQFPQVATTQLIFEDESQVVGEAEAYQLNDSQNDEDSLYERSIKLKESLSQRGLDSDTISKQLQVLSPGERHTLLKQIVEIEKQENKRPKVKEIMPNLMLEKTKTAKPKMQTPKMINRDKIRSELAKPELVKSPSENAGLVQKPISSSESQVLLIQLLSVYPDENSSGTILPILASSSRSSAIISFYNAETLQYEQERVQSERIIVPAFPTNNKPIYMLSYYEQNAKYVLTEDLRKGRMHVSMPKDFLAQVVDCANEAKLSLVEIAEQIQLLLERPPLLDCNSFLPLTNNEFSNNELILEEHIQKPITPLMKIKIPRPNNEQDLIEIHLLSGITDKVGLNYLKVYSGDDSIINAQIQASNSLSSVEDFLAGNCEYVSKYPTSVLYVTIPKQQAEYLIMQNSQSYETKDYEIKYNYKVVKEGELSLNEERVELVDNEIANEEEKSKSYMETHIEEHLGILATSHVMLSPNSKSVQQNHYLEVESFCSLVITVSFLSSYTYNNRCYELSNILLKTEQEEYLKPRTIVARGDFQFYLYGDEIEKDTSIHLESDHNQNLLFFEAKKDRQVMKTDCCRLEIQFSLPELDNTKGISELLINNFSPTNENELKNCLIYINSVLQQGLPGIQLPILLYSQKECLSDKSIEQIIASNYINDINYFYKLSIKQSEPRSAAELQKVAEESNNMHEYIENQFSLIEQKLSRSQTQIVNIHSKNNISYITEYIPVGYLLEISILSLYDENQSFGFEFLQLVSRNNQLLDYEYEDAVVTSSIQSQVIKEGDKFISDSKFPASNIVRELPWIVEQKNLQQVFNISCSSTRKLCSFYIKFSEKQEISAIEFISQNIAEIVVSMDGHCLIECICDDTDEIEGISFCKAKMNTETVIIE